MGKQYGKIVTKDKGKTVMNISPPNYEQSERTRKNIANIDHPGGGNQPSQDT